MREVFDLMRRIAEKKSQEERVLDAMQKGQWNLILIKKDLQVWTDFLARQAARGTTRYVVLGLRMRKGGWIMWAQYLLSREPDGTLRVRFTKVEVPQQRGSTEARSGVPYSLYHYPRFSTTLKGIPREEVK